MLVYLYILDLINAWQMEHIKIHTYVTQIQWSDENWMLQKCCYWFAERLSFMSISYIIHLMLYVSMLLCEAHPMICFVSHFSGLVVSVSASGWRDCWFEFMWVQSLKYSTGLNDFVGW
jgi:hypothetical protein